MQPEQLGRFQIIREIGRGAMGRVYLAQDPSLHRSVAIKTLAIADSLPAAERAEVLERFFREARAAAALLHPNIVTVFDVGGEDSVPYLAMEYIEGEGLDAWTRAPRLLPIETIVEVGIQAAEGLGAAHAAGLVHRDVKPANLMLVGGRQLKITDFGLAKQPEASLTSDGTLIGTPNYMSPEQISGRLLDGRSDLFSLGVVLYELLAGARPFQGDTVSSVMYQVMNETPRTARELNDRVPAALSDLVGRLLDKDPDNRPSSGGELAALLAEHRANTSGARPVSAPGEPAAAGALPGPAISAAPPGPFHRAGSEREKAGSSGAGRSGAGRSSAGQSREQRPMSPADILGDETVVQRPGRRGRLVAGIVVGALALAAGALFAARDRLPFLPGSGSSGTAGGASADQTAAGAMGSTDAVRAVRVVTDPPGARLSLDGAPIDSDTLRLDRNAGARTLRAALGCREGEATVDPSAAPDELHLALKPHPPISLPVATDPPGAAISFDGAAAGGVTPASIEVDPCRGGTLTLALDGYETKTIAIDADLDPEGIVPLTRSVPLTALPPGKLVIERSSYAVEVFEAGRSLGSAGKEMDLPAGARTLTLENPDLFLSMPLEVRVEPGATVRVKAPLPRLGRLTVQAFPSNCRVYARRDGGGAERFLDEVPLLDRPMAPGRYRIRAEYVPTGASREQLVTVPAGGSVSVPFRFGA